MVFEINNSDLKGGRCSLEVVAVSELKQMECGRPVVEFRLFDAQGFQRISDSPERVKFETNNNKILTRKLFESVNIIKYILKFSIKNLL